MNVKNSFLKPNSSFPNGHENIAQTMIQAAENVFRGLNPSVSDGENLIHQSLVPF